MNDTLTGLGLKVQGHLKIFEYACRSDYENNKPNRKLLDRRNAVHKDNASILVINAITNRATGNIQYMAFGTGGTTLDSTGSITFKSSNDDDLHADLYSPVFQQMVDNRLGALPGNSMAVRHIANSLFTDIDIRGLLDVNEPFGQSSANTINDITEPTTFGPLKSQFSFDEIGLKLSDSTLITHVIFTPILKTASSLLEVVYTLRIAIGQPVIPNRLRITEIATANDLVSSTIRAVPPILVESDTASDLVSTNVDAAGTYAETSAATETITRTVRYAPTILEPASATESLPTTSNKVAAKITETTAATETRSATTKYANTIIDAATATDLVPSVKKTTGSITEPVTATKSTTSTITTTPTITETAMSYLLDDGEV